MRAIPLRRLPFALAQERPRECTSPPRRPSLIDLEGFSTMTISRKTTHHTDDANLQMTGRFNISKVVH